MFSVTPGLATNASAAAAAAAAFNPYLSPVSPGLMPPEILPSTPVLMASSPAVSQVPNAAAAAAAQKLLRTDRLEVNRAEKTAEECDDNEPVSKRFNKRLSVNKTNFSEVDSY